jgi:hypothetical protein
MKLRLLLIHNLFYIVRKRFRFPLLQVLNRVIRDS